MSPFPQTRERNGGGLTQWILTDGRVGALCLESLIGGRSFPRKCLFGEFARTQIRPPYTKLHRHYYLGKLTPRERSTMRWGRVVLAELKPRIARGIGRRPDSVLFTDASTTDPIIDGVRFRHMETKIPQLTTDHAPSALLRRFHLRNKIHGSELLAPP